MTQCSLGILPPGGGGAGGACWSVVYRCVKKKTMRKGTFFALGIQHFPRDLANVNEWKIMFDPSYDRIA